MMVVIQWPDVEGECCSAAVGILCRGSFCCGCGPCNIFCCNCEAGCNGEWWNYWKGQYKGSTAGHVERCGHWGKKKRKIDSHFSYSKAQELFNEVDADGSRNITMDEADQYLKGK